ncbi:GNAT family N-acetyltransferase [Chitinibacter sp. SCUT-21]|uniref:GNAT family N-acetyltransferase n=1 Tax=Chitinibacter sp. SCUT-21 TaxID=2970891 RepID=UPI0035A6E4F1
MTLPTLNTERLTLRALQDTDAPYLAELGGEWAVAGNTGRIPHPYTAAMAAEFIAACRDNQLAQREFIFAICANDVPHLLGCVGLSFEGDVAELGYWLGQPYWGQGFASEAARAVVQFAFQQLKMRRLTSDHLLRNPASGRVLAKLGFEFVGPRLVIWRDGQTCDLLQYQLNYADWATAQPTKDLYDSVSASQ